MAKVFLHNGKPIMVGGKVATSKDCCCGAGDCPDPATLPGAIIANVEGADYVLYRVAVAFGLYTASGTLNLADSPFYVQCFGGDGWYVQDSRYANCPNAGYSGVVNRSQKPFRLIGDYSGNSIVFNADLIDCSGCDCAAPDCFSCLCPKPPPGQTGECITFGDGLYHSCSIRLP